VITELAISPEVITVERAQKLPLVLADPVQLNRVFVNVLKNAQEAMVDQPDPQLHLTLEPADGFVRVRISDNGPGIPDDELDKIWVTFHSTKTHQGHSGLGLPACRLILEHIGGHISVESQPAQGTTVTVDLPEYQLKAVDTAIEPSRGKILLVDDDDRWQQLAKSTLEAAGYKVVLSSDNYQIGQHNTYDLILIDDLLSNKDSLEVLRQIKAGGAIAKTVVVSSNPRVERTKERKLLGVHNLLPKPYTQASLLSEVRQAVSSIRRGQA
jgi:CheY-like chemotaxis protein